MPRRSRAQALPAPVQHIGRTAVRAVEGIVPGLDFCNHDTRSPVRWTVWGGCGTAARSQVYPLTHPESKRTHCTDTRAGLNTAVLHSLRHL